jgi:DNA-binding IscR family transcriptional regulator
MRLIDGPLAPFGDAEQLRELIDRDLAHRTLYQVFLDVRDAAARILDNTTLADLIAHGGPRIGKNARRQKNQKKDSASILPMVVGGKRE